MSFGINAVLGQGEFKLHIGPPDATQPPEFWADRAMEKLIMIADSAPAPIRDQAIAFQERIRNVLIGCITQAVDERKARDALIADRKDPEVAQLIREDK